MHLNTYTCNETRVFQDVGHSLFDGRKGAGQDSAGGYGVGVGGIGDGGGDGAEK